MDTKYRSPKGRAVFRQGGWEERPDITTAESDKGSFDVALFLYNLIPWALVAAVALYIYTHQGLLLSFWNMVVALFASL